ncbi:MAG: glycosyltransferase family 2 protein [Actinobacteria bacterium]|nr:glycosyltransferase family 2 protein [Actinomycetota bacterium]MCL6105336.1 glycosyltransferase family 2 protein [Actinomycetota bacterium]
MTLRQEQQLLTDSLGNAVAMIELLLADYLAHSVSNQALPDRHSTKLTPQADWSGYADWFQTTHVRQVLASLADNNPPDIAVNPLFSILLPVYKPPLDFLGRCIDTVRSQSYTNWELCICDDASNDPMVDKLLRKAVKKDKRIKLAKHQSNMGISAATNTALSMAKGDFVAFLDHDDELTDYALASVVKAIQTYPELDIVYSDEDKIDETGKLFGPFFKPDWSPDLLLTCAYTCHFTVMRGELVRELGGLRSEVDGAQDWDLMIRASEKTDRIVHIPQILYHWRACVGSAATSSDAKPWAYKAQEKVLSDAMERRGEDCRIDSSIRFPGYHYVRRRISGNPLVSIIIPFKDQAKMTWRCLESLSKSPGYDSFEVILVNNGSVELETKALIRQLTLSPVLPYDKPSIPAPRIKVLDYPNPFNWSAINNFAVDSSSGELLLFLNNDIEAVSPGWLHAMVEQVQRHDVGVVGAKLVFADGITQHAGVVIGLGETGIAAHFMHGISSDDPGYMALAQYVRNTAAVTGACLMTRRQVFEKMEGFDESIGVAFNDIDFCLRVIKAGFWVVYTPLAELIHHESHSRGKKNDQIEIKMFWNRWKDFIIAGDPWFSPHFSLRSSNCVLKQPKEEQWRKSLISKYESL